jgi:hypothetical protein
VIGDQILSGKEMVGIANEQHRVLIPPLFVTRGPKVISGSPISS